jgi:hypothetical protein
MKVVVDTIDTGNYVLLNPSDLEQKIFTNTTIRADCHPDFPLPRTRFPASARNKPNP